MNYRILVVSSLCLLCTYSYGSDMLLGGIVSSTDHVRQGAGRIVRDQLTAEELAAPQAVHLELKLRNSQELEARIEKGEVISIAEMQARYFPTHDSWLQVAGWAASRGLSIDPEDTTRMTVFAHSDVAMVSNALHVRFARVIGTDGSEYSSAIDNPTIDSSIAGQVIAVFGLQPHLRPHPNQASAPIIPIGIPLSGTKNYGTSPITIAQYYHIPDLGYDGTGQTIVILGESAVLPGDLSTFWTKVGVSTTLAQFQEIDPGTPPVNESYSSEGTKDIEWASAMAPRANIIYLTSLQESTFSSWILNNLSKYPSIHQVSISWSFGEDTTFDSGLAGNTQYFQALTAVGVTVFASSGDYGSSFSPTGATLGSDVNGVTAPEYPATDPYVTAVGGTTLYCTPDPPALLYPGIPIIEGAWTLPTGLLPPPEAGEPSTFGFLASTGGTSATFNRPAWQVGAGLPSGNARCVPDVAAMASSALSAYAYFTGEGGDTYFGGTSLSAPIWAGIGAVINQALQQSGRSPLGLAGPKFYPLLNTSAFNPMPTGAASGADSFTTTASSGVYEVGPNYTLITGLGSPNVAAIIEALIPPTVTGSVTLVPAASLTPGQGTSMSVSASSSLAGATITYQWQLNGVNIPGATQSSYTIASAGAADRGRYQVVLGDGNPSVTVPVGSIAVSTSDARLVNISARAFVTDANPLIAGYATAAVDTNSVSKSLLITGKGPFLSQYGLTALPDPVLDLYGNASNLLATDIGWTTAPFWSPAEAPSYVQKPFTLLQATAGEIAGVGSGAMLTGDSALIAAVPAGNFTSVISSNSNTTGNALAEVYDADSVLGVTTNTTRIINLSARSGVGAGQQVLIVGFAIQAGPSGAPETVEIRVQGPNLERLGITAPLAQPVETLYDVNSLPIASNIGWCTAPVLAMGAGKSALTATVGIEGATSLIQMDTAGNALPTNSADCAIVATLPPGNYTVIVSGVGTLTGTALCELYEIR